MIYAEIRNANRELIGIIDNANSIIWHSKYYGVGDFEIYCDASDTHRQLLQVGYYVTRQDNDEVGIIENISISFTLNEGYMITATGRFAKSILDRRLIYKLSGTQNTPTILSGDVELAVRGLVFNNAISCSFDSRRNFPMLVLGELSGIDKTIVDENGNPSQKQVSYQNLLEYTETVLQEYKMAAKVVYRHSNLYDRKLVYIVYEGTDRNVDNEDGNDAIIFSTDYDNLTSCDYDYITATYKNTALIGGAGEGLGRFYTLLTDNQSGLDLRELFVDASSVNRTYKDNNDQEQTYTDAEYTKMLCQKGSEKLNEVPIDESFAGDINVSYGKWQYGVDYFLGDVVTVQDNKIDKYINVRITEATEVQDRNGYSVDIVFGD